MCNIKKQFKFSQLFFLNLLFIFLLKQVRAFECFSLCFGGIVKLLLALISQSTFFYVTYFPSPAAVEQIRLSSLFEVLPAWVFISLSLLPLYFLFLFFRARHQEEDRNRGKESWRCRCRPENYTVCVKLIFLWTATLFTGIKIPHT